MVKRDIVKTILHLKDNKGFTRDYQYGCDWTGNYFVVPSMQGWVDELIYKPEPELIRPGANRVEFRAERVLFEALSDKHFIKHVHMREV